MENDEGVKVDLYIPRKCSATNRIIETTDQASVQLNVPQLDAKGHLTGKFTPYVLCGFLRSKGLSDHALNRLATKDGFLKHVVPPTQMM